MKNRQPALHIAAGVATYMILCRVCGWVSRHDTSKPRTQITLRNLKRCPKCNVAVICRECGQPMLQKGERRENLTDYRHASGCPAWSNGDE